MHYFIIIFIYIVDDWNRQEVRDGTNKVIKDLNLKILYEKNIIKSNYFPSPHEWMHGIYIVLLLKIIHHFIIIIL